jgi:hypothetical protein
MLSHDDDGEHTLLIQIGEELVEVRRQKALFRHRVQVAIEAVDDDDLGAWPTPTPAQYDVSRVR